MKRHNLIIAVVMVLLLYVSVSLANGIVPGGNAAPVPGDKRADILSMTPAKGLIQVPPTIPGRSLPPVIVVPGLGLPVNEPAPEVNEIAPEILGSEIDPGVKGPEWKRAGRLFKPSTGRSTTTK